MTASGFDREAAYSVFEGLRPSADQMLDRAAFATYSLDLVAVAALILLFAEQGRRARAGSRSAQFCGRTE